MDRDKHNIVATFKATALDQDGSVLVEATVMMTIIFIFLLGGIDFLFAFYQWNAASKAVQVGARIAAVADPVATGLFNLSTNVVGGTVNPGDAMPQFTVTCPGTPGGTTCSCSPSSGCVGIGAAPTIDTNALNAIVYGRGNSGSCNVPTSIYFVGMCSMFPGLTPSNVQISYTQTGLGYAGRPGPVPTVQVSLVNVVFQYYFLGGLLGFGNVNIPPSATAPTTITAEGLSCNAQGFAGASGPNNSQC